MEEEFKPKSIREFFEGLKDSSKVEVPLTPYEILQVASYNRRQQKKKIWDTVDPYDYLEIRARKDIKTGAMDRTEISKETEQLEDIKKILKRCDTCAIEDPDLKCYCFKCYEKIIADIKHVVEGVTDDLQS